MLKKKEVVMLPTNKKANDEGLYLGTAKDSIYDNKLSYVKFPYGQQSHSLIKHHLYILSDEEIKEGDWCYHLGMNRIERWEGNHRNFDIDLRRKIIATTDRSLHTGFAKTLCPKCNSKMSIHLPDHIKCISCGQEAWNLTQGVYNEINKLPQPSLGFINEFIAHYNAGTPIKYVMVEYEADLSNTPYTSNKMNNALKALKESSNIGCKLKVNPKDNTITIRKVKDSWTRDEHSNNIEKFRRHYEQFKKDSHFGPNEKEIEVWVKKWLDENL